MRPTITTRLAAIVPHKHVPLIRFLGPRRLVQRHDTGSANQASGTTSAPAGNVSDYPIFDYASLPSKYKTPGPTPEEMEAIERAV
ncbi:hypothetical protein IWQ61_010202 [Dispira simplex]|nr:hypothetical protein IWQ61_010202 [Dispira simplex]